MRTSSPRTCLLPNTRTCACAHVHQTMAHLLPHSKYKFTKKYKNKPHLLPHSFHFQVRPRCRRQLRQPLTLGQQVLRRQLLAHCADLRVSAGGGRRGGGWAGRCYRAELCLGCRRGVGGWRQSRGWHWGRERKRRMGGGYNSTASGQA